ncbi:MAG: hypothetical protein AAF490_06140 [Chloroflexota bacterium]
MFIHSTPKQQSSFVPQNIPTHFSLDRSIIIPITLSWSIKNQLGPIIAYCKKNGLYLRFLLVLTEDEVGTIDEVEMRYALLWSLHNQLQSLNIQFSIETAVGSLEETAVHYAKIYQTDNIYNSDSLNSENFDFMSKAQSFVG